MRKTRWVFPPLSDEETEAQRVRLDLRAYGWSEAEPLWTFKSKSPEKTAQRDFRHSFYLKARGGNPYVGYMEAWGQGGVPGADS